MSSAIRQILEQLQRNEAPCLQCDPDALSPVDQAEAAIAAEVEREAYELIPDIKDIYQLAGKTTYDAIAYQAGARAAIFLMEQRARANNDRSIE